MIPTVLKQAGYATATIGKWGQLSPSELGELGVSVHFLSAMVCRCHLRLLSPRMARTCCLKSFDTGKGWQRATGKGR
jgi:hypothetical protein